MKQIKTTVFDIEIYPNANSVVVVAKVPATANEIEVERMVASFVYAFAFAEGKTLDEMETYLSIMMTLSTSAAGTVIQLKREHNDPLYFERFDKALSGASLKAN